MSTSIRYDAIYQAIQAIQDNNTIEDRREYTVPMLAAMYDLSITEAGNLHSWIDEQFRPGHIGTYSLKSDAQLAKYASNIQEALH